MTNMSEEEYLENRLEDQIQWYSKKSTSNQCWYKALKITDTVLALSIVPLGYYSSLCPAIKYVCSVAGIVIAFSNLLQNLNKYHENWIQYRSTAELLKHEKHLYLTRSGGYASACSPFNDLVERCESIISSENIDWAQLHKSEPCKKV